MNLELLFVYGIGSQNRFPFNVNDYTYGVGFYKVQINYKFKDMLQI